MEGVTKKDIRFLFLTVNVGSIFEDPTLMKGWLVEHQLLLQKNAADFVAFSFQVRSHSY
jgi:hypothetical protein